MNKKSKPKSGRTSKSTKPNVQTEIEAIKTEAEKFRRFLGKCWQYRSFGVVGIGSASFVLWLRKHVRGLAIELRQRGRETDAQNIQSELADVVKAFNGGTKNIAKLHNVCEAVDSFIYGLREAQIDTAGVTHTKEALALATLKTHPDWTDGQIAKAIGISRTTLYDWKDFKKAKEILKQGKNLIPKGSKNADTGNIEARDAEI